MAEVAPASAQYSRRSPMERCKERRRRRIQMRRNAGVVDSNYGDFFTWSRANTGVVIREGSQGGGTTALGVPVMAGGGVVSWRPGNGGILIGEPMHMGGSAAPAGPSRMIPNAPVVEARGFAVPVVGAVAVAGRQREMEDAVAIHTNLCSPVINLGRPVHYFGVYDGHGGDHFALTCKEKMHEILKEELMRVAMQPNAMRRASSTSMAAPRFPADESLLQEAWRVIITLWASADRSLLAYSGTTAVAVVLTDTHIVVGNCGDSRAILYRGGRVIRLSFDHKPDRADEKARILATGGRVLNMDCARVEGILAMSRAIGDRYLKPYVISEPEVTFTRRDQEDEFLVLATDGLWDVMSTEMTCRVTRQCLTEPRATAAPGGSLGLSFPPSPENELEAEMSFPSRSASAAALLTRLALARNSTDNICVVVVDLKRAVMWTAAADN
ncbi:probable protein phosphatase 2C 75 [Sesamum indicum]|uniref:protein-serine/threonine phosphatase n=1 Tax=Sesamum indicum TaxID=4182 RepID=A0A6I9U1N1_SESIN|nr:probable protein phosphatase 2C 75 [Sesamum indicum]